jgi:UDPglucose--hexose-1-phosphate uridylyltransferase
MPELRHSFATREWVIIATERARRPEDFAHNPEPVKADSTANCPFCPGKENKTPAEILAFREPGSQPNGPGWRVRVTLNAFPALNPIGELKREKTNAGFLKMNGVGIHEVIIESPEHEQIIATMPLSQVEEIYQAYRERYIALAKDNRFEAVILFKNHGRGAGTSLHHPHSQIIATPVMPRALRDRIDIASDYLDQFGSCLICDMMAMERKEGERLILESANFLVFSPFASRLPFETWVVPKQHSSNFETITPELCRELAGVMQKVLQKFNKVLHNPDFNYAVYSAPCHEQGLQYCHWNMKIFPRISNQAGFELGSGMMINSVVPEAAAKFIREA